MKLMQKLKSVDILSEEDQMLKEGLDLLANKSYLEVR